MKPYEILKRFQENHPLAVKEMRNSDHNYSPSELNPYHLEGDVWTHTMMVFNYAVNKNFPIEVLLATLLHDVGKAYTKKTRKRKDGKNYVSFFGHDGVSYYRSLDILRQSYSDMLSEDQIVTISKLVANHSVLYSWQNSNTGIDKDEWVKTAFADDMSFLSLLTMLVESDALGRIAIDPSDVSEYRKYRDFQTHGQIVSVDYPTLYILVGPPGCGKSTWVSNHTDDAVVISSDDLIMKLGEGETYNEKWNSVDFKHVEKIMMGEFQTAVKEKKNIIIDRTNMSRKSRRRFLAAMPSDYNTKAIVFATSHDEIVSRCFVRAEQKGKTIGADIIHTMEMGLSYPLLDEVDEVEVV